MPVNNEPKVENNYLAAHAQLLLSSYLRVTGKALISREGAGENIYHALFEAPFCVVSHNTEDVPIFNYANRAALKIFEMNWFEFTRLPSRNSAEAVERAEREKLLARVSNEGFVNDYSGVRISSSGKRFLIEDATVWNLVDDQQKYCGQAAMFYKWSAL